MVAEQRRRLGNVDAVVQREVCARLLPRTVRRLVVAHQRERPIGIASIEPAQTVVGDQVGHVAAALDDRVAASVVPRLQHHRVVVMPLTQKDTPPIEPGGVVLGSVPEVPFAEQRGLVASGLQPLRIRAERVVHRCHKCGDTVDVVEGAGEYGRPTRSADRVGTETRVEPHSLGRHPIEVGRVVDGRAVGGLAVGRDRMGGVIVAHDEQQIGLHRGCDDRQLGEVKFDARSISRRVPNPVAPFA